MLDLNSGIWVRNLSFDPMAAAVDWLDAYRSGDLKTILRMYADDAVVECGSGGMKTITGKQGLRAYWQQRLKDTPHQTWTTFGPPLKERSYHIVLLTLL